MRLSKEILLKAAGLIEDGELWYMCNAVYAAAGEDADCQEEFTQVLRKYGVELNGRWRPYIDYMGKSQEVAARDARVKFLRELAEDYV